jgi:protein-S-isoprenylcysteine O-methyltransferase Ste14
MLEEEGEKRFGDEYEQYVRDVSVLMPGGGTRGQGKAT